MSLGAESAGLTNIGAFRALRTLRALRPLRAVSRWEGMKVCIQQNYQQCQCYYTSVSILIQNSFSTSSYSHFPLLYYLLLLLSPHEIRLLGRYETRKDTQQSILLVLQCFCYLFSVVKSFFYF